MKQEPINKKIKKSLLANGFDDPNGMYKEYWEAKTYESEAETMAVDRFLKDKHFNTAVDIGGGYGKLSILLKKYADEVILTEPNKQRLDIAKMYLKGHPTIRCEIMIPSKLKFESSSVDLITMVRVMHHISDPSDAFTEISRVLTGEGFAIIEVANYTHAHNRVKFFLKRKRIPSEPVEVNSDDLT